MPSITPDKLPRIGILSRRTIRGVNSLQQLDGGADAVELLQVLPVQEAFEKHWATDAHFVTYRGHNTADPNDPASADLLPRCNKIFLPQLRQRGADLHATMLAFDWDRPANHNGDRMPWDAISGPIEAAAFLEAFDAAAVHCENPWFSDWSLAYSTVRGFRFVYLLTKPLPVDRAEEVHRWCVRSLNEAMKAVKQPLFDEGCTDWTRIFRLPFVMRDTAPTWEAEKFGRMPVIYFDQWDRGVDPDTLGSIGGVQSDGYAELDPDILNQGKPDREWARTVGTVISDSGRKSAASWFNAAKRKLRNKGCSGAIFEHQVLAFPGSRDKTLHSYVGQAVSALYYEPDVSPAHIYALFIDAVEQLEPDRDHPDWSQTLWDHVKRLWAKEDAKVRAAERKVQEQVNESLEIADSVIQGMRAWCRHPQFVAARSPEEALAWAVQRFIIINGSGFNIMRPDGFYDLLTVNTNGLYTRIRELGMSGLIQTEYLDGERKTKKVSQDQLLQRYGTVVRDHTCEPGREEFSGGYIRNVGQDNAQLVTPAYRRAPFLEPAYNSLVDEWLRLFFGEYYEKAIEWIAWALAFEEGPICALSVEGEPGSGKQMLVRGMAECLENPILATAEDLTSQYQYGLMRSPFLHINEGWPRSGLAGGARHPADQFRMLVGGDQFVVNRRFMAPVVMSNPVRIIFTANNEDVVKMLTGGRNLSPEDREALGIRLMHMRCGTKAAAWLKAQGGMALTGRPGNRWVAAPGTGESDYIVARHFLHLHKNRKGIRGSRFLVEGSSEGSFIEDMRTGSGSAPLVVEAIMSMIENRYPVAGYNVEQLPGGKNVVWVTSSGILQYYRHSLQHKTGLTLTLGIINSVLKGLVSVWGDKQDRRAGIDALWHQLDLRLLHRAALKEGYPCSSLERIISGEYKPAEVPTPIGLPVSKALTSAAVTVSTNRLTDFFRAVEGKK